MEKEHFMLLYKAMLNKSLTPSQWNFQKNTTKEVNHQFVSPVFGQNVVTTTSEKSVN
jgi:hypothetical protein